jgi:hypothetical protein
MGARCGGPGAADQGRAEEIAIEWECPTPELLAARDPAVVELLTDPSLPLPTVLPDGEYRPQVGDR